jgi:putative endonuclease
MTRAVGGQAEDMAAHYLTKRKYKIVARNVIYPFGELDLVAKDKQTLVFIEVKYRKTLAFGSPHDAVSRTKQRKIILAAKAYLQTFDEFPHCRFDVISLWGDLTSPKIEHMENAFFVEDWS